MFLLKDDRVRARIVIEENRERRDADFEGIRCPRCGWRPSPASRWSCRWSEPEPLFASCGTSWNTFSTRGRCPGCSHQWQWTSCHGCEQWSPHEDWYTDDPDTD